MNKELIEKCNVLARRVETPSSNWSADGKPDPHGKTYDCERAGLHMGNMTDDELANGAFMNYDMPLNLAGILAGTHASPIAWMTAVKDRIRWLSRSLEKVAAERDALAAELKSLREQEPIAWFCHSNDGGYYEFSTFQAAAGCASNELAECRAEAKHDGEWPEDVVSIKFGAVLGRLTELKGETDGEGWVDYQLIRPVPAEPVNARLLEVLKKCRDQFEHYVSHHINKGEFEKAASNGSFVMLANAAISEAGG